MVTIDSLCEISNPYQTVPSPTRYDFPFSKITCLQRCRLVPNDFGPYWLWTHNWLERWIRPAPFSTSRHHQRIVLHSSLATPTFSPLDFFLTAPLTGANRQCYMKVLDISQQALSVMYREQIARAFFSCESSSWSSCLHDSAKCGLQRC